MHKAANNPSRLWCPRVCVCVAGCQICVVSMECLWPSSLVRAAERVPSIKTAGDKEGRRFKKTAPAETNGNSPDHLYRRLSALSYRIFPVTLRQKHRLSTRAVWSQTSDTNCVNWSWEICLFSVVRHISGRKVEMLNYSFQLVKIEDLPFILFNIMLSPFLYVHSEPCYGFICFLSIFLHFQHFLINFFFLHC